MSRRHFTVEAVVSIGFLGVVLAASLPSEVIAAAQCNFDKPVGSCTGSISIESSGGSKPSYSAEITVHSSANACSKVEYYLDSTPNTTILRNSNAESESLFSTKPISKKNIKIKKCTEYEDQGASNSGGTKACMPAGLLKEVVTRETGYVRENKWKIDLARKNRQEELQAKKVNSAYVAEMDQFLAQYAPLVEESERLASKAKKCLADPSCSCRT
jgi:hypothetical protein